MYMCKGVFCEVRTVRGGLLSESRRETGAKCEDWEALRVFACTEMKAVESTSSREYDGVAGSVIDGVTERG